MKKSHGKEVIQAEKTRIVGYPFAAGRPDDCRYPSTALNEYGGK